MPVPPGYPVLMPDTPSDIVAELGKSRAMRRLKRELITGAQFQQEYMILRQQRINEVNKILEYRRLEGVGEKVAEIDAEFYWQMIDQYGYGCWADPDFVEDTLEKNPGMRLRINRPVRISFAGRRQRNDTSAAGNRAATSPLPKEAPGRTRDPFPNLVQGIEHPAALPRANGGAPLGRLETK